MYISLVFISPRIEAREPVLPVHIKKKKKKSLPGPIEQP